jgi:hypothetical protein
MKTTALLATISLLFLSVPAVKADQVSNSSSLSFNRSGKQLIEDRKPVSSDNVNALIALQQIVTPLSSEVSLYDYELSLRRAQDAIGDAEKSTDTTGLAEMQSAIFTHELALIFWKECLTARSEMLCDQKRPVVAEILRRYPKPQKIEELAVNSPLEALRTVRKPWINTRIRATLRDVVEYIPSTEQKKVLQLLWQQAEGEAMVATSALK